MADAMIASMRDLRDADRALEALGPAPGDTGALLEAALGGDRSLGRLDALLGEIERGNGAVGAPRVRPGIPAKRRSSRAPAPALANDEQLVRATLVGLPSLVPSRAPAPRSEPPVAAAQEPLSAPPPPAGETPVPSIADLLEQPIEPDDFAAPDTAPEPAAAPAADDAEDELEMLIDDDEILEIEDLEEDA
jgi:hypothetical protein